MTWRDLSLSCHVLPDCMSCFCLEPVSPWACFCLRVCLRSSLSSCLATGLVFVFVWLCLVCFMGWFLPVLAHHRLVNWGHLCFYSPIVREEDVCESLLADNTNLSLLADTVACQAVLWTAKCSSPRNKGRRTFITLNSSPTSFKVRFSFVRFSFVRFSFVRWIGSSPPF